MNSTLFNMQNRSIFHQFKEYDLEQNSYYYEHLNNLKEQIQTFNKQHQLYILKIIHDYHSNNITQNKNGSFINLTNLPLSTIKMIGDYASYVNKQERELKERETKVHELHKYTNTQLC